MPKSLPPTHPGEVLRDEFMVPHALTSDALARAIEVGPSRVNGILLGRRGVTADIALRLARLFGTSHQFWLNLQTTYDLQCAEDSAGQTISRIKTLSREEADSDDYTSKTKTIEAPTYSAAEGPVENESKLIPLLVDLQRTDVLCLHLGELEPHELLVARAAVRFCYSEMARAFLEEFAAVHEVARR